MEQQDEQKSLFLSIIGATVTGCALYGLYHYHKERPRRLFNHVREQLRKRGVIHDSWFDSTLKSKNINGQLISGYEGGVTIDENGEQHYYTFFIDKKTREVAEFQRVH